MKKTSYWNAAVVEAILKDAVFVGKLADDNYESNGHAIAYTGYKYLYRGPSGNYIVNSRLDRGYHPPKQRVLSLPMTVRPAEYLSYEAEHQAEYSDWYDMIGEETVETGQDEPKRVKGFAGLLKRFFGK